MKKICVILLGVIVLFFYPMRVISAETANSNALFYDGYYRPEPNGGAVALEDVLEWNQQFFF